MAGERVDLTIVARDLGLGRATIYRWFGSRERLVAEVIADDSDVLISRHRREVRRRRDGATNASAPGAGPGGKAQARCARE